MLKSQIFEKAFKFYKLKVDKNIDIKNILRTKLVEKMQ